MSIVSIKFSRIGFPCFANPGRLRRNYLGSTSIDKGKKGVVDRSSITKPQASSTMPSNVSPLPEALEGLEPRSLWRYFGELSSIPRPSKHEGKVLSWLKRFAEDRGLRWEQDSTGNLCIYRPGSGGGEMAPPVILQGHIDMVTEKNADVEHDFMNDPIRLKREGDWITAEGTTLGADNGIGVCTALAVLDLPRETKLPPIEGLFTVDEETGLTGAFGLDGSLLKGRVMLNLDTEEWPEIFIGCAGGGDSILTLEVPLEELDPEDETVVVSISGLMGGHSGLEIHEDRANAIRLAAIAIDSVLRAVPNAQLCRIMGGDKRNAIPRECTFVLSFPTKSREEVLVNIESCSRAFASEFGIKETGLHVLQSLPKSRPNSVMRRGHVERLIDLLLLIPHGVIKYSHAVPGLVETSNNMACVKPLVGQEDGCNIITYSIQCATRSSLMSALERTRDVIRRIGVLCGATVLQDEAYPGWDPNPHAHIVSLAREEIGAVVGRPPELKAIHAGLECGIIGQKLKNPDVESVSYGPTIHGAHSPDERVEISTVEPFWNATLRILSRLAER